MCEEGGCAGGAGGRRGGASHLLHHLLLCWLTSTTPILCVRDLEEEGGREGEGRDKVSRGQEEEEVSMTRSGNQNCRGKQVD